jgi:TRAP-type C4-dicarboxylate transport system permease small subunit
MIFVMFSAVYTPENLSASGIASLLSVAMNILFLIFVVWKIWYSITHLRDKMVFMSGIFYLLGWAVSRYLVLFGDYLTTSLIFVGCGVLLYMLNNIWDKSVKKEEKVN